MKKDEDEYGMHQPLGVEEIVQLASAQGQDFWLRELCIQLAAMRGDLQEQLRLLRESIRFK